MIPICAYKAADRDISSKMISRERIDVVERTGLPPGDTRGMRVVASFACSNSNDTFAGSDDTKLPQIGLPVSSIWLLSKSDLNR